MRNTKVIIVDDEPIILAGLENWLSRDHKTISFDSAEAFLKALIQFDFEDGLLTCLLLDFQMPGMNGIELQTNLKLINTEFPIIFMSGNAQQADIIDAWHGGAVDFILKPFTPVQVTAAIEKQFSVLRNRPKNPLNSDNTSHVDIPITKREAEVLLLLGRGLTQAGVAQHLRISIRTVKMYRSFLKNKLNLNTLAQLANFATQYEQAIKKVANGS